MLEYLFLNQEAFEKVWIYFTENKKLKADLEAVHLSTEAEKKEVNILNLSLKQKDAEIDRLKELTRLVGSFNDPSAPRRKSLNWAFRKPKDFEMAGFVDGKHFQIGAFRKR